MYQKHLQDSIDHLHILLLSGGVLSYVNINLCFFQEQQKKRGVFSCLVNQLAVRLCILVNQPLVKAGGVSSLTLQESAEMGVPCPPQL